MPASAMLDVQVYNTVFFINAFQVFINFQVELV